MKYSQTRSQMQPKQKITLQNPIASIDILNQKVELLEQQQSKFELLEKYGSSIDTVNIKFKIMAKNIEELQSENKNLKSEMEKHIKELQSENKNLKSEIVNLHSLFEQIEKQSQQKYNLQSNISKQPNSGIKQLNSNIKILSIQQNENIKNIPSNRNEVQVSQVPQSMITQSNNVNKKQERPYSAMQQQKPNSNNHIIEQQHNQEINNNNQKKPIIQCEEIKNLINSQGHDKLKQILQNQPINKSCQQPPLQTSESNDSLRDVNVQCNYCNLPIHQNLFQLSCSHSFHQACIFALIQKQIYNEKAKSITCVCHKEIPSEFLSQYSAEIKEFEQLHNQLKQNQTQKKSILSICLECKRALNGQQGNCQFCTCQNNQQKPNQGKNEFQTNSKLTQYPKKK